MWINKIHGTILIKSTNHDLIIERTLKGLRKNQFLTDRKENKITFQRYVQFTEDTGKNKLKLFLFSYKGEIIILKTNGNIIYEYFINIVVQLIKMVILFIIICLIWHFYNSTVNPLIFGALFILLVVSHRALIKNHFINIINVRL
jgi:hypothetical protein